MKTRTIIILLALVAVFAYQDYHHFTRKYMLRVRDKVVSVNYDTLNMAVYDTTLREFRYQENRYTEEVGDFRIYDASSYFTQCIYHYNEDTLVLDFGEGSEWKRRMMIKVVQKDVVFDFFHGGSRAFFTLHDEPIDNVDTLSLVIDTTNQSKIKVELGLHYHEIFHFGNRKKGKLYDQYFKINGCMVCDKLK